MTAKTATPMLQVTYDRGAFLVDGEIVAANAEERFNDICARIANAINDRARLIALLQESREIWVLDEQDDHTEYDVKWMATRDKLLRELEDGK